MKRILTAMMMLMISPADLSRAQTQDSLIKSAEKIGLNFAAGDQWRLSKKALTFLNGNISKSSSIQEGRFSYSTFSIFEKDRANRECQLSVPEASIKAQKLMTTKDTFTLEGPKVIQALETRPKRKDRQALRWTLTSDQGTKILLECSFSDQAKPIEKNEEPDITLLNPTQKTITPVAAAPETNK